MNENTYKTHFRPTLSGEKHALKWLKACIKSILKIAESRNDMVIMAYLVKTFCKMLERQLFVSVTMI